MIIEIGDKLENMLGLGIVIWLFKPVIVRFFLAIIGFDDKKEEQ